MKHTRLGGITPRCKQRGIIKIKVDDSTFKDLIEQAEIDCLIGPDEAKFFQKLRKEYRNPYVHTKDIKKGISADLNNNHKNFFEQAVKMYYENMNGISIKDEAEDTVRNIVRLFPIIARRLL
jgi:hypothetical protein